MKDIGKTIRVLREQKGLTQEELASRLFVTRQTLSNYENGRTRPDLEMLEKIAGELDQDISALLCGPPANESRRRELRRLLTGSLLTLLALLLMFLAHHLDRTEETYRVILRLWNGLLLRPLFCLAAGWTLLQGVLTLAHAKPLSGSWMAPLRRCVLPLLALYGALELPFLLLWWFIQFRPNGTLDLGVSLGSVLNQVYMQVGALALRAPALFFLLGALLRLSGFPAVRKHSKQA